MVEISNYKSDAVIMNNEQFTVAWDSQNGALKSLVLRDDPDGMNWIEGLEGWGEIRVRPMHFQGRMFAGIFLDSEKLEFKSISKIGEQVISLYGNDFFGVEVCRQLCKDSLKETFTFTNISNFPLYFNRGDLGILTPFNDDYGKGANECIHRRCNAHIWCGGENSWVKAVKMGVFPKELALVLNEGSLDWYSIRRSTAGADRGDIVLHPDPCVLAPGATLKIAWTLVVYPRGEFKKTLLRQGGTMIEFANETIFPNEKFAITLTEPDGAVRHETRTPEKGFGEYAFSFTLANGRTARANGYCSPSFDELVQTRVRFIVEKQQCLDENSPLYGAFLPYDNEDQRQYFSEGWRDMNACRERTAMPMMIARYLLRHGEDESARRALDLWEEFACREFFDTDTCAIYDGIGKNPQYKRLYNGPQLIGLWKELYLLKKDPKYLDYIEKSILNFYQNGGTNFYPNGCNFSEQLVMLKRAGRDVSKIEELLRQHIENIIRNGAYPPEHEVKYEQSIIAPAVTILSAYQALVKKDKKTEELLAELADILWRFNGNQPDYRLNETAIRHWDGFWFGKRHTYGDTLHQHSALSARAFMQYAEVSGDDVWRKRAEHTYRNVLAMFTPDGRGTAAYMLPLTVTMVNADGTVFTPTRWVHGPDPLANDQDSALYNCMGSGFFGKYGESLFY